MAPFTTLRGPLAAVRVHTPVWQTRMTGPGIKRAWWATLLAILATAAWSGAVRLEALDDGELATRLRTNRDRLLDGLKDVPGGQWYAKANACGVWKAMDTSQRYTFLRDTDLLGQRSLLYNYPVLGYLNDPCECPDQETGACAPSPCTYDCRYKDPDAFCTVGDAYTCAAAGKCGLVRGDPVDHTMALDRVPRLLWVAGSCPRGSWQPDGWCVDEAGQRIERQSCGGENNNRTFFQADDTLIFALRNFDAALPGWHASGDRAGAHKGFTHTSETLHARRNGQATGQTHFFAWDHEPPAFVEGRTLWSRFCNERGLGFACGFGDGGPDWAARLVELDVDFTRTHESSTVCYYSPYLGHEKYAAVWTGHTSGNGPAYDYDPCGDGDVAGNTAAALVP